MSRNILVVEGSNDEHVFKHLPARHGGPKFDAIIACKGVSEVIKRLPTILRTYVDAADVVGVVIDADNDPVKRWREIRRAFTDAGYPNVPRQPHPRGTIVQKPRGGSQSSAATLLPRAGIWMMPDNKSAGALEDWLISTLMRDEFINHVKSSVDTIPNKYRKFRAQDYSKAMVLTVLAWQKQPGRQYDVAIKAGYFEPQGPLGRTLISWLNMLYAHRRK